MRENVLLYLSENAILKNNYIKSSFHEEHKDAFKNQF